MSKTTSASQARQKTSHLIQVIVLACCVAASLYATPVEAGTHRTLPDYRALNRAQAMRALGYSELAAASSFCPAMKGAVNALRRDLLRFYKIPFQETARDAVTRAGTRAGAAEAEADMRRPRRYCDGLEEVLSVWRSYTLRPDTEYP